METPWWDIVPSSLAQWVGAVGTILAVTVALFKDSLHGMLYGADLRVTCKKDTPWTVKTPTFGWPGPSANLPRWKGDCYFVRLKVDSTGGSRAEKVEVSLSKVEVQGSDGNFVDLPLALPLNMKWSNRSAPILDGISFGMSAFCDVISICDPANQYQKRPVGLQANKTVAHLETETEPLDDSHVLAPGTYRLKLRIAAANVTPFDRVVEFTHTGDWAHDDAAMRRDYLSVSIRSKLRLLRW
jgi:hypothetical protein